MNSFDESLSGETLKVPLNADSQRMCEIQRRETGWKQFIIPHLDVVLLRKEFNHQT